jgi:predicted O-methyltransferase YrrM
MQRIYGSIINGLSKRENLDGCWTSLRQYRDGKMDTLNYILKKYNIKELNREHRISNVLRDDFAVLLKELGFLEGCEVGVYVGRYSKVLLDSIPNLNLYCVDCWAAVGSRNDRRQKKYYKVARTKLREYRNAGKAHLIRKWSMDAVRDFDDESLDFVYIDANHEFDYVIEDIIEWSRKVRPDGIVSGHDFFKNRTMGVVEAVRIYTKMHKIKPWFVLDDESDTWRTKNTWFWVKR